MNVTGLIGNLDGTVGFLMDEFLRAITRQPSGLCIQDDYSTERDSMRTDLRNSEMCSRMTHADSEGHELACSCGFAKVTSNRNGEELLVLEGSSIVARLSRDDTSLIPWRTT